ncbi:hypothetical protein NXS98_12395 [Fontisphaera persica]|uniref:hypothetical protein n=1 Tax=Fontisphaera persica TaxID=2974023 RepID=UPI0024BF9F52|nr:hypothetical protein [Fontisphaera persica]WCJ58516.1 hypothetical protein NXS98_12395 [Fontisphaera persica]
MILLLGLGLGCAPWQFERPMVVGRDTFAFANELKWTYHYNPETGKMEHQRREPAPQFTHRCVPMAKAARQFLFHAGFDPRQPPTTEKEYQRLVKKVLSSNPRHGGGVSPPVIIPGFTNLYDFSVAHEALLKEALGGAWQSYVHCGNFRMVFPFSRKGQAKLADRWERDVHANYPPLVHVVTFPRLTINHTILLIGLATPEEVRQLAPDIEAAGEAVYFKAYDPNQPERPLILWYQKQERQFYYPRTTYFPGGRVNVYEMLRTGRR